jgi:uncharacterized membrane protein
MEAGPPVAAAKHPALLRHDEQRLRSAQSRIADAITSFAGSMTFVYVHIAWFTMWILIGVERYPFGLLTMIVSLEAIFLSTFVMISQNRADARRQVLADAQWQTVQTEEHQNVQIIGLSNQILELTTAIHKMTNELATLKNGKPGS